MIAAGYAMVLVHICTNFLGKSPGTIPPGFLALEILSSTSLTDNMGAEVWSSFLSQAFKFGVKHAAAIGVYSWLMLEKCAAMISADCSGLSPA